MENARIPLGKYVRMAALGNAGAQYTLAKAFLTGGFGLPQNKKKGLHWLCAAAKNGLAMAQWELAQKLFRSQDKASHHKAVYWLLEASRQEFAPAQLELADRYCQGRGTERDLYTAMVILKKAAANGNTQAMYRVGRLIIESNTELNTPRAQGIYYYRLAAQQGHPGALHNLGICYAKGVGVSKDCPKAKTYFVQAIQRGEGKAIASLALLLFRMARNPTDKTDALTLCYMAEKRAPNPLATELSNRLKEELSPLEVEKAKVQSTGILR